MDIIHFGALVGSKHVASLLHIISSNLANQNVTTQWNKQDKYRWLISKNSSFQNDKALTKYTFESLIEILHGVD